MGRIARVVAAKYPHHVTRRGNRRQDTFFCEDDYRYYIETMSEWCNKCGVGIWAYCLMPNHVQLIAVPETEEGLRQAIGETHRRYTRRINFREKWKGHLWQGRFSSYVMDEQYLLAAARYMELNPVKARLVKRPGQYQWSSAKAHLTAKDDELVRVKPLLKLIDDWDEFLSSGYTKEDELLIHRHEQTGRPLGNIHFIKRLESKLERILVPGKGGRPRKNKN